MSPRFGNSVAEQFETVEPFFIPITLVDCRTKRRMDRPCHSGWETIGGQQSIYLSACGCHDAEQSRVRCFGVPRYDGSPELMFNPIQPNVTSRPAQEHVTAAIGGLRERPEAQSRPLHPRRAVSSILEVSPPPYSQGQRAGSSDEYGGVSSSSREHYPGRSMT